MDKEDIEKFITKNTDQQVLSWKPGSGHLTPMRSNTLRTYSKVTRSPHFARKIFLSEIILVVESRSSLLQKSNSFDFRLQQVVKDLDGADISIVHTTSWRADCSSQRYSDI